MAPKSGKKTRPLATAITGTQPAPSIAMSDTGSEIDGSGTSIPPTDPTMIRGATTDDSGRKFLFICETFNQFVDTETSPGNWFGEYLRKRRQHSFWPTYRLLADEEKAAYWKAFTEAYTWTYEDEVVKVLFESNCKNLYKDFICNTKKMYWDKGRNPKCPLYMTDEVWAQFCAHWGSDKAIEASERAKRNRASSTGTGTKHTSGTINFAEHYSRMTTQFGPHVSIPDVFVSTHTTPSASPDQPPQWVDEVAESTYSAFNAKIALEIAEGRVEQPSSGTPAWSQAVWNDVASGGRKKRGSRVYGMGEYAGQSSRSTAQTHGVSNHDQSSRIQTLEAELAQHRSETQQLVAQHREETQRLMAQMFAQMQQMQQCPQQPVVGSTASPSSASPSSVRNIFTTFPPPNLGDN